MVLQRGRLNTFQDEAISGPVPEIVGVKIISVYLPFEVLSWVRTLLILRGNSPPVSRSAAVTKS